MDLAFISPTAYLKRFSAQGHFYLALAHLVDDNCENSYSRYHRQAAKTGKPVYLDNGLFEGKQVSTEALLRRGELLGAQVVCAPDVLYDNEGTVKRFKQFIRDKQEYGLVAKVMGIPQASNSTDWWNCFRFMELSKECDIIGLSILSIPQSFKHATTKKTPITSARMHVIQQLRNYQSLLGRRIKPCHLLGLGESFADVTLAKRLLPDTIVSNDSSSAFVHGMHGIRYDRFGTWQGGKILEKLDFDIKEVENIVDIDHNVKIAKEISKRVYL